MSKIKLAIFDRDGTLNRKSLNRYLLSSKEILWPEDIIEIQKLCLAGIKICIATNQSCISKKLISKEEVIEITQSVVNPICSIESTSIFICKHDDGENCGCRKPQPGLILNAMNHFEVAPEESIYIGDSRIDIQAADAASVKFLGVCWDNKCLGEKCLHTLTNIVEYILTRD
jgi:D-glycero-D-manno-heptose 1,7-bisphosphate phosphatase